MVSGRIMLLQLCSLLLFSCSEKERGDNGADKPQNTSKVEIYTYSSEVEESSLYRVAVGNEKVKTIPTNAPHVAIFGAEDKTLVKVEFLREKPSSITVRPLTAGYECSYSEGCLTLKIGPYDKVSVEPDDDTATPLFIFVNPIEQQALAQAKDSKDILLFRSGRIYDYPSDLSVDGYKGVYIQGGAVVSGSLIQRTSSRGLKIEGCGIIDARCNASRTVNGFSLADAQDVEIRDITVLNNTNWTFRMVGCDGFKVDNVKAVGEMPYNDENDENDAIHLVGCSNGEVSRSFGYSWDDAFNIGTNAPTRTGDTDNVLVSDCIGWNTRPGNTFTIGWPVTGTASNITFRNCHAIHSGTRNGENNRGAIGVHNSGSGLITDVLFENIHIEDPREYGISIYLGPHGSAKEYVGGRIENITLKGIYIHKSPVCGNRIRGYDAEHCVDGVTLKDVYVDEEKITSLSDAGFLSNIYESAFYENVKF